MHIISYYFLNTRKTKKHCVKHTVQSTDFVTLVFVIYTHTLSSFTFFTVRTKYAPISRGQKNIFNLHQLVMQNKALMFYYLSKI